MNGIGYRLARRAAAVAAAVVLVTPLAPTAATAPVQSSVDFGKYPHGMTTSADGSKVYAAVQDYGQGYGNPAVAVVSAATRQFIKWIVLPAGSNARYLVAGPTGNRIYALVSGGVVLIDTVTDSVSAYVPFPAQPLPFPNWMPGEVTDLAVSPDGATLYFTQYGPSTFRQSRPGRVLVFSAATQTFTGVVGLDSAPGNTFAVQRVAVSPNGNDVYVVTGGPPVHLDARTNPPSIRGAVTIPGPFGSDSNALVVSRDGTRLYVGAFQDGNVYVVDTATDRTTATITVQPGYDSLVQVIVGHSAGRLYVAEFYNNGAPRVAVVDTNTNLVSGWITPTGVVDIWSIALSPDDRTLYALDEVSWATNAARLDILDNIA